MFSDHMVINKKLFGTYRPNQRTIDIFLFSREFITFRVLSHVSYSDDGQMKSDFNTRKNFV